MRGDKVLQRQGQGEGDIYQESLDNRIVNKGYCVHGKHCSLFICCKMTHKLKSYLLGALGEARLLSAIFHRQER